MATTVSVSSNNAYLEFYMPNTVRADASLINCYKGSVAAVNAFSDCEYEEDENFTRVRLV